MTQQCITTATELEQNSLQSSSWQKTTQDLINGLFCWRIWLLISWQDVRLRYRRSHLGPLWITISMAVQIYTMGFLYSQLLQVDLNDYYPYLAGGLLTWSLISSLITDSTIGFISSENYLRQMKIPYTIFIMRILCRNLIIFFHNIVVIIPIILMFHLPITLNFIAIIPGLLIILLNGFGFGFLFSMLGARYRDINQIIQTVVQVAFFLTPVMWQSSRIPLKDQFIIDYNPFAQFLGIIRQPLIGQMPSLYAYLFTTIMGFCAIITALIIFNRMRKQIIYWL